MMPAMYSAISGLEAHQTMLNVTANNLANVDTIGYKGERTTFDSALAAQINGGSAPINGSGGTNPLQYGLGVQVGSVDNEMGAGSMQSTGNALDVAIQGDGFLVVGNPTTTPTVAGSTAPTAFEYTRAGNLTTNANGFLTTTSGQYVMGNQTAGGTTPNSYIVIPQGSTNVSIGSTGQVTYTDPTGAQKTAGYLSLASFQNEAGLTRDPGTDWSASNNSGAANYGTAGTAPFTNTQLISGELEQSNVDMATEFTNMIQAERGYQANSSVITTANTMMQTLVQMAG